VTCAAVIGAVNAGLFGNLPPQDDDDDRWRKPPRPEPPKPPSGADIVRNLVKDVKEQIPETEDSVQE
jgi:hypothetical protein